MAVQLIFSRSGCGKTHYVTEHIRKRLLDNKKSVLVVPEQYTHIAEHKLLSAVRSISPDTAEVTSFNKMMRLAEKNNGIENVLTPMAKSIIMSDILSDIQLEYYTDASSQPGFTDICLKTVSEFKKYCVFPEQLEAVNENNTNARLKLKLNDIIKIYTEYVSRIAEKGFDSDDGAVFLAKKIGEDLTWNDTVVFFDEFTSFIPQELEIIKSIAENSSDVLITLCCDGDADNALFAPVWETVRKIRTMCETSGIELKEPVFLTGNRKHKQELAFIEENLLPYPKKVYDDDCENVSLYLAADPYAEVEYLARTILKLCRDSGYRFKDIGVVVSDIGTYSAYIKSVFEKYSIACFIDEKTPVINHRAIIYVMNILDIYLNDYGPDNIFEFLKSGFCSADIESVCILENYCRRTNMHKNSWTNDVKWNELVEKSEVDKAEAEKLCFIRDKYVKPLVAFHDAIKGRHSVSHMCTALYGFLNDTGFLNRIEELLKFFETTDNVHRGEEYEKIWNIIVTALDELVELLGDKTVNVTQFRSLLHTAFSGHTIGLIPTSLDEVFVGNITRSKMDNIKILFVLGVNDGVFPAVIADNDMINDSDKAILADCGIELSADTKSRAFFERFFMYITFTLPSEKLFICFSRSDSSFAALRPSFVLSYFKSLFPDLTVESDLLEDMSDFGQMEYISQVVPTKEKMIEKVSQYRNGEDVSPVWLDAYRYFNSNYDIGTRLDKYYSYSNVADDIDKEVIDKFFGEEFYTTISRLQRYRSCKFSYFLEYVLKLKENEEHGITALDTGSFVHGVIEQLCRDIGREKGSFAKADDDYIYKKIDFYTEEFIKKIVETSSYVSKRQLYLIKRFRDAIFRCFSLIKEHILDSKFEPLGYEIRFDDDNIGCIEFELSNGKKAKITGVIDRSDVYKCEEGEFVRVIDYKTGNKEFSLTDVFYGLDVQLFVYLNSLVASDEKYKYAGALYFRIDDPIFKADNRYDDVKTEEKLASELKMKGLIVGSEEILSATDGATASSAKKATYKNFVQLDKHLRKIIGRLCKEMSNGDISMQPYVKQGFSPCSYCGYKTVCGFDVRKKGNNYEYLDSLKDGEIWDILGGEANVD